MADFSNKKLVLMTVYLPREPLYCAISSTFFYFLEFAPLLLPPYFWKYIAVAVEEPVGFLKGLTSKLVDWEEPAMPYA